jgi:putative endonuclease
MRAKDRRGRRGEDLAAARLQELGIRVLERNWRSRLGELDIIGAIDDALVICEVKTRSSVRFGRPLEAVTEAKVQRMQRLAFQWCALHGVRPPRLRIDVVEVLLAPGRPPVVDHHPGVA